MKKRTNSSLWYGGATGLVIGLLSLSRWGLFSLLGFYPADLCSPKVAKRFFRQGGYINQTIANKIKKDSTPIDCAFVNAVKYQSLSSLQPLIDSGADVNSKDDKGQTPLFFVKSDKVAQLLIDNGANIKAKGNQGKTPLFYAQSPKIAQLLVDKGADVNARDRDNYTPLFIQVDDVFYQYDNEVNQFNRIHDLEVAKFLIEKGAVITRGASKMADGGSGGANQISQRINSIKCTPPQLNKILYKAIALSTKKLIPLYTKVSEKIRDNILEDRIETALYT